VKAIGRWVLVLGIAGFASGYIGPIILDPEANQGPLLGLLVTGPGGALAGLALGSLARVLPWSTTTERNARLACAAALALGTLWYSLPGPRTRGILLEARIDQCLAPRALEDAAFEDWDGRIARVTWAAPRAGWKEAARRLFERPDGVVLDLTVSSRLAAREQRKPWNRGRTRLEPVAGAGEIQRVFARYSGTTCDAYPPGPVRLYYETTTDPQPGPWPADDLPGLLGLVVAEPPPAAYLAGSSSG